MAELALGLMSGTSGDGVSAALVRFVGRRVEVLAHHTTPYARPLHRQLRQAAMLSAPELSALNMVLGASLARAATTVLRRAHVAASEVAVIGSHGHTIYHGPRDAMPSTLQLGEPAVIAERLGIPVIAQFRMRDLAAGGEGAPLVPVLDAWVFGNGPVRALQNLGGIANVTVVGRRLQPLAFDTGPGNALIDLAARAATRGRLRYDPQGRLARRGRLDARAARRLLDLPYFHRRPPKSTGKELFNVDLMRRVFGTRLSRAPLDVLATVTYVTAASIAESYRRFVPVPIREVIVSGGGARNRTLMAHLTELLHPVPVHTSERYGLPVMAKEPAAFAFLAWQALHGRVNHLPHTTGARHTCILGSLTSGDMSIFRLKHLRAKNRHVPVQVNALD